MDLAAREVAALLRERHRLRAGGSDDFTVQTQAEILAAAEAAGQTFSLLLGSVAGISLLVGGIGILALMVISVREQTREIGVRRAVGARRRDTLLQFAFEAVTLSLVGGVTGSVVGLIGGFAVSHAAGWPTAVSPLSIVLTFGVSMAIGVFFGAYPASRAAHVDPIIALREGLGAARRTEVFSGAGAHSQDKGLGHGPARYPDRVQSHVAGTTSAARASTVDR